MKDHDKQVVKKALPYALLFNWAPPVAGIVTVILAVTVYLFTFERIPMYLILLIGCYCTMLPRILQNNILLGMYRKGELDLFRQIVRKCGASNRYAPFILGECAAGEHQAMIDLCSKMLSQRQWNRRLRYLWLSGLADCYFELGDCEKLLLVCDAFDRLSAKEKSTRRIANVAKVYERYRAFAQKDEAKCREFLAQGPESDSPIHIYESAFYAARVSWHVLGDLEAAKGYYAQAASWNEAYSFVRTAKLELEAIERGECYTDMMPEVLPDPEYVLRPQREYVRTNLSVMIIYFFAMALVIVSVVTLSPGIIHRRNNRELTQLLQKDFVSVQQLDRFNVLVDGKNVETMYVCLMDDHVVIGSAFLVQDELCYQNQYLLPAAMLQKANKTVGPICHQSITGKYEITSAFYVSADDLPEQPYYVTTIEINNQTYYYAVTEVKQLQQP